MKSLLHKRLESMCKRLRTSKHWLLKDSKMVRIPSLGGEIVTTKRAIYAAFVGPIGEGEEVRAKCELPHCMAPEHLELATSRNKAKALSIPELEMLSKPDVYQSPEPRAQLPKSLSIQKVNMVKHLFKFGNTLAQIRGVTGLNFADIVRINNGAYDKAVEVSQATVRVSRVTKSAKKIDEPQVAADPSELTAEEQEWLRSIGKG